MGGSAYRRSRYVLVAAFVLLVVLSWWLRGVQDSSGLVKRAAGEGVGLGTCTLVPERKVLLVECAVEGPALDTLPRAIAAFLSSPDLRQYDHIELLVSLGDDGQLRVTVMRPDLQAWQQGTLSTESFWERCQVEWPCASLQ